MVVAGGLAIFKSVDDWLIVVTATIVVFWETIEFRSLVSKERLAYTYTFTCILY